MLQGNGLKVLTVVFFLLMSGYYLYPTLSNYRYQSRLASLEGEEKSTYERENFADIRWASENALKLGLDLRGGMLVVLEVRVDQLVGELATDRDAVFNEVMAQAQSEALSSTVAFVDAFAAAFAERDPDARLSRYFRNSDRGITRRSSNSEVVAYLRDEADAAVDRAIEIIRDRIDRFGVTEPSIQKQGTRRVIVELPGVEDPERVRKLLRGTARLEFRLMVDPRETAPYIQAVIDHYDEGIEEAPDTNARVIGDDLATHVDTSSVDTTAEDSAFDVTALLGGEDEADLPANQLLEIFRPYGQDVILGSAFSQDTARAMQLLTAPEVAGLLPRDVEILWTANPINVTEDGQEEFFALGVRKTIELTGDVITEATADFDQIDSEPKVSIAMNSEGARTWSRITGANVGKKIAIVLDNVVYSYPNVNEKISGGRSEISGLDSFDEAKDIVTVLKSGALPAPVDIEAEQTVGPSLGEASIRAGTMSLIIGMVLVVVFMILYYQSAGIVADLALLLNIVFIFGILAGFQATLTLPGIAGIVLTIGMAVDANVLIFERIREEQATGKTLKAAIAGGYANALSAILDANITTFLVAAILYSFGKGPIQGFAVTLMAGIVSSLFTAIFVTRIVFDWLVGQRRMSVSYG
ncbi:MAG TPA: protein translocase subunit SecD [Rhodothermales bacterium]|nr:protein translocase subunit SecD [Rhodothermales bacterium]